MALLIGITCGLENANSARSLSNLFFIGPQSKSQDFENHRSPHEKYTSPEYKNLYETFKAQASTAVYFKPIEGYFGLYYKTTPQPLTQSIKPETATKDAYTTPTPHSTTITPLYQVSRPTDNARPTQAPETSSEHPYYLKPKETLPIKMDEPLFYSDYHNQPDVSYKTAANNYYVESHSSEATTTIKSIDNSVPVYYLSKPYYAKQDIYATSVPTTTARPSAPSSYPYATSKPSNDKSHSKAIKFSSPLSQPKTDDVYLTAAKPAEKHRQHNQQETSTPAYSQSTTNLNVEHKGAYQTNETTPKRTSNYETSKPSSHEKANDAKTTQPGLAQASFP